MASSSLLPTRRITISCFPRAVSKYHFPFTSHDRNRQRPIIVSDEECFFILPPMIGDQPHFLGGARCKGPAGLPHPAWKRSPFQWVPEFA